MNKNKINKNYWAYIAVFVMLFSPFIFTSCDDNTSDGGEITITSVFLEDVNSSVPDRLVTFARLGQLLRIEGSGFTGLKKIYINGYSSYFNPVYVTDTSLLVNISGDTPTIEAEEAVRNTIRLVNNNNEFVFDFEIRSAAPRVDNISNTLPLAGETITVSGSGLTEVTKVVFPGNVEVTEGIVSDTDGEFFTVTVPAGVSEEGGSLFIESANGGAYSPAYFNFKKGVILDFDGNGTHGYFGSATGMIFPADLANTPVGVGNMSHGTYVPHRPVRIASFAAATNRDSEVFTSGSESWRTQFSSYIPTSTPLDQVAFQFDVYVPEPWVDSGYLQILLINNFNGGEWTNGVYNYVPWIVNGEVKAFQTEGWTTVTVPFNKFYRFSDGEFTFENLLAYREGATYKNFGIFFNNSDIKLSNVTGTSSETEFPSSATSVNVYTDNWRIVSLDTPTYSDFPE